MKETKEDLKQEISVTEKQSVINTLESIGAIDMVDALYEMKKNGITYDLSKEEFIKMVYLGFKFQGEEEPSKEIEEALTLYEECEENKKAYLSAKSRDRFLQKTKKIKVSDAIDIVLTFSGMILFVVGVEVMSDFLYTGTALLAAGVVMYLPLIWQYGRHRRKLKMDIRKTKAKVIVLEEQEKQASKKVDAIHKKYMLPTKDGRLQENLKDLLSEAKEYEKLKEYNSFNNTLLKYQPLSYLQKIAMGQQTSVLGNTGEKKAIGEMPII